jgi:hypothetical protein
MFSISKEEKPPWFFMLFITDMFELSKDLPSISIPLYNYMSVITTQLSRVLLSFLCSTSFASMIWKPPWLEKLGLTDWEEMSSSIAKLPIMVFGEMPREPNCIPRHEQQVMVLSLGFLWKPPWLSAFLPCMLPLSTCMSNTNRDLVWFLVKRLTVLLSRSSEVLNSFTKVSPGEPLYIVVAGKISGHVHLQADADAWDPHLQLSHDLLVVGEGRKNLQEVLLG